MKKLSNKIKTIYTLTAILVLSICMLLFPVATKRASADQISDAAKTITIKSAYIQVSNQLNATNEISEFAIMFKAEIGIDAYNVITNEGQDSVKFGLLIGPTNRMSNVSDYATAVAEDFVSISNVGTRTSGAMQQISFGKNNEYNYVAGIRYNEQRLTALGINLKGAVDLELTAIPFYTIDGTAYAVVENQKSCTPRQILTESFIKEQDAEITNIPEQVITTYVGEVNEIGGEHYICRDTGRLMSTSVVGGELTPKSVATEGDVVYLYGKKQATINTTKLDKQMLEILPMYGDANLVVYKADGTINKYATKVAERVITRFADVDARELTVNSGTGETVYPNDYDATPDYLSKAALTIKSTGEISARSYNSIFFVNQKGSVGSSVWYYGIVGKTEGLYVLAKDITIPSAHNYCVSKVGSYGFMGNLATYNKKEDSTQAWYGRSAYMIPAGNAGFMGILDGRGNNIDVNAKAQYGIVPPAYNATIRNVGLLNLSTSYDFGGICTAAKNTAFENVYATLKSASNYKSDFSNPLVMMLDTCTLNNVIIEANAITEKVMTNDIAYGSNSADSGYGQGKTTSSVFAFKHFPDVYTDANGTWRYVANPDLADGGIAQFVDNGAKTYLGKIYTKANITTVRFNAYASNATDAFNGTTGNNVYVVGTSPLYVHHEYAAAKGTGADYNNYASYDPTTKTTVFVNNTFKYNTVDENNAPVVLDTNTTDYYKISTLVDTNGLFTMNSDNNYSLGEIILRGKQYRYGVSRVAEMLATPETNELEVRLVTQAGWYDVNSYDAMAQYVNANTDTPFDSAYWNVSNGIVTWKGLSA